MKTARRYEAFLINEIMLNPKSCKTGQELQQDVALTVINQDSIVQKSTIEGGRKSVAPKKIIDCGHEDKKIFIF